ncbi:MAG TPA: acetyl-CoA carboxylase, carboxyltransferase subunit beta [Thermohalobaculum sp.]|nr:acetyl-CoA carboxylase, carboxyltransferase subunit beta [Thermohalobaculum sp.]
MNWISDYVPPKIKSFFQRREMPENLWTKCESCGQMIFHRELREALHVCPGCNYHMAIAPRERFAALFDGGLFTEVKLPEPVADPLHFRDEKRYTERLRDTRRNTGEQEAMIVAHGAIFGLDIVAAGQDFRFMGGSMGIAVGNAMLAAAETAVQRKAPLVVFTASGGARMQEGILSLMQLPRTSIAVEMVREARLPYVVVLTNPTTGGVTASFAMLGDIHIAEPDALICFAGPRVIEQTIRETLPEGFQRSEYLLDHGMIDRVVPRRRMRDELGRILHMLMGRPPIVHGELTGPKEEPVLALPPGEGATPPAGAEAGARTDKD